jgi:hypothetical protein
MRFAPLILTAIWDFLRIRSGGERSGGAAAPA